MDRTQSKISTLVGDINDAYADSPARSLLIKGSKDLKWEEAYGVMSTIAEGGMTTMLLATEEESEK